MKRRLSAIVLALGMSLSVFSMGVYAAEAETEAVTEQVTEAATEVVTEAAAEAAVAETEAMTPEEQYMSVLDAYLAQVSSWTDEDIETIIAGKDITAAAIAGNWRSVKEELGAYVEVTSAELNEDGTAISGTAIYEKTGADTMVNVVYSINEETQTATMNWTVDYPMSTLLKQAGLNTLMGLGIVFATLFFLALLIGRMKLIPELLNKTSKKAPEAPKAAPAPAAAPVVAEEEYVDDLELVAVITAAIAASQNTSSDGFVVRSIKKANKKNWQRA